MKIHIRMQKAGHGEEYGERKIVCPLTEEEFVVQMDINLFSTLSALHYPAILSQLTLMCDLMNKPASYYTKTWHSAGNTLRPKVQNTPPLCITHLRYLSSL